jgi:hypothetical protein
MHGFLATEVTELHIGLNEEAGYDHRDCFLSFSEQEEPEAWGLTRT